MTLLFQCMRLYRELDERGGGGGGGGYRGGDGGRRPHDVGRWDDECALRSFDNARAANMVWCMLPLRRSSRHIDLFSDAQQCRCLHTCLAWPCVLGLALLCLALLCLAVCSSLGIAWHQLLQQLWHCSTASTIQCHAQAVCSYDYEYDIDGRGGRSTGGGYRDAPPPRRAGAPGSDRGRSRSGYRHVFQQLCLTSNMLRVTA